MEKQIQQNKKHTMSKRTIERCIKEDPRILKDGQYHYINDEARFERRYQRPEFFGEEMRHALFQGNYFTSPSVDRLMHEFIRKWGALMMFIFIEAVRPFEDKSLSLRDRADLVRYWVKNALPLDEMFLTFQTLGSQNHLTGEMEESDIKQIHNAFEKTYPDLYKILMKARSEQAVSLGIIGEDGNIELIHGKTYHSGLADWLSYLKELNPEWYEEELERLDKEKYKKKMGISNE